MAIYNWISEAFCHEIYVFLWQNTRVKCKINYRFSRYYRPASCTATSEGVWFILAIGLRLLKKIWWLNTILCFWNIMFWEHNLYRAYRFPSTNRQSRLPIYGQNQSSVSLIELLWILDFLNLTAKFVKISHKSELKSWFWELNSKIVKLNLFQNGTSSTSGLANA